MLSNEEKKTLSKAIKEIKDKAETVFKCFDSKATKENSELIEIFIERAIFANAIKSLERLVERY